MIGGVWTVAAFGLRVFNRAQREMTKLAGSEKESTSALPSVSPVVGLDNGNGYFGRTSPRVNFTTRAGSWMSSRNSSGGIITDWKGR